MAPLQSEKEMTMLDLGTPDVVNEDASAVAAAGDGDRALYFEYSTAADPIRPGLTPRVPYRSFSSSLYSDGPTRVVPLDLSAELKTEGPATGPALSANFVRVLKGDSVTLDPVATSTIFYVIKGAGAAQQGSNRFDLAEGDFLTIPGTAAVILTAAADTALYYVNDAPLLRYLGVRPDRARFQPTIYKAAQVNAELAKAVADPDAANRSRVSVVLGNSAFPLTRTVTHTLWAMYGTLVAGTVQRPHRHQSIALDLVVDCAPGCYSLVGLELNDKGEIVDPQRIEWESGCAFVTPPGYWHAHFNESGKDAHIVPIQDAGLQTYLRTLDIRFG
jgi:gentisate 1,2-dioxygenase